MSKDYRFKIRKFTEEEFYEFIEQEIRDMFPEDEVSLQQNLRNNDTCTSLLVRDPSVMSSPVIHLKGFFEEYNNGDDVMGDAQAAVRHVAEVVRRAKKASEDGDIAGTATRAIQNWRENVKVRLVKKEGNEYLSNKVYMDFLDMAKIYAIDVVENGCVVVTREMAANLNVSIAELDACAMRNTNIEDFESVKMAEILCKSQGIPYDTEMDEFFPPFLVLTNKNRAWGATALLSDAVMDDALDKLGTDEAVVFPSSVHEVLFLDREVCGDLDFARNMVMDINGTVVEPEDVLSDSVYLYTRGKGLALA